MCQEVMSVKMPVVRRLKRSSVHRMMIVVTILLIGGCLANPPIPSTEGKIIGGDKRLRSILRVIQGLRDKNATKPEGVVDAWYSATICPTPGAIAYEALSGVLPTTGEKIAAEYQLLYSDTLREANVAVVTEVLGHGSHESKLHCVTLLFLWEGSRWVQQDLALFRIPVLRDKVPDMSEGSCRARDKVQGEEQTGVGERARGSWKFERGEWKKVERE